jgi:hypothetical protein
MKLYKTTYVDGHVAPPEKKACWQGTQNDAAARRKELKTEGMSNVETKDVDVPTDKPGLLAWLNENVNTAKGE